jgi:hypothetical protein
MALSFDGLAAFPIVALGLSGFANFGRDPALARAHSIQGQRLFSAKLPLNTIYVNIIHVDRVAKIEECLWPRLVLFACDMTADSADDRQAVQFDGKSFQCRIVGDDLDFAWSAKGNPLQALDLRLRITVADRIDGIGGHLVL